jgi:mRNA interferase MazF
MPYEPGRILLVNYPFTDRTTGKLRPVLVVSSAGFNNGEDVVVVPLSSRIAADDRFGFPIQPTDPYFPQTQLQRPSTVKWTKPMTISSAVVVKQLGHIPWEVLGKVQGLIKSLFS